MVIDGVIELLLANSGVSALVGARIYENVLPRGYTLPAIATHQYGGSQEYQYSGPADVGETQVQLDCYGATALSARQVAEAVRATLISYTGTLGSGDVVQGVYLERDMAMPFLPHADQKGLADRWMLGFRVVSLRPQV